MIRTCKSVCASLVVLTASVFVLGCSVMPGSGGNGVGVSHNVNVGASENVTINEQNWQAAQPSEGTTPWTIEGGEVISYDESFNVRGADLDQLYQTGREGLSSISFDVPKGVYVIQLHFAETSPDVKEAGKRTFDIEVEDVTVLSDFDPYASAAGHRTASIRTINNVQVNDGTLDISFTDQRGSSLLHGISIQSK